MRKLLLIVLIFLIMGAVSAHDNLNDTADPLLKDTEYNSKINDDDGIMVVEQNGYIPVDVNAEEAWSLNVYIDKHDSPINDEYINMTDDHVDIPTSVMIDDEEVPLGLGKHNIVYEFKFINTTSVYKPDAFMSDSGVYFNFESSSSSEDVQNSTYRFTSQFNIVKSIEPISTELYLEDINITRSDWLSFYLKGIRSGKVNFYLDEAFFYSFEFDENPCEELIDTTKLPAGSYNLVCTLETEKAYAEYKITADTENSMINVKFTKTKNVYSPNKYITILNTTLNVGEFPESNSIYIDAPSIDITYTRSIPVRFEGDGMGDFSAYIDGEKVYNNTIMLSWENTCYMPTKDGDGNYFDVGTHNLSFEFVPSDKYMRFNPEVSVYDGAFIFNFLDSQDSSAFLNDRYVINTTLNIIDEYAQIVPIDSQTVVSIVHTEDIKLKIEGLPNYCDLTVFVDDVEIYDGYTDSTISIKTFYPREFIEETNERDIQTGNHSIRFDFKAQYQYDVDVSFKGKTLQFKFSQNDSNTRPNGVHYQLNTTLIVNEKEKTVHILKVKNYTYIDETLFAVEMDLYEPENDDDWDEEEDVEIPIGTQDVGIIVSDENGIVYIGDYLMNLYERLQWNYEFENENLPKAGTYTMKIVNLADNTYDTASFEVKKAKRTFNKKYSSDDFNVLFTLDFSSCRDDLNDPLHITLNDEEKTINVKKGLSKSKREVLFEDIDPGVYTATFTLEGNDRYQEATLKSKVTVKKESPEIQYESSGNILDLTIDIGKSKTDAVLTVSAGGEQKEFTVDKNTKHLTVEFNNLNAGYYSVEIDFKGNERYSSKTLTAPLEIAGYPEPEPPLPEPVEEEDHTGIGSGNNTGGTGTGHGNSNVTGSGNSNANGSGSGTFNGQITLNGNGVGGDAGSEGSGDGEGVKSYEITKKIKNIEAYSNALLIFLIIAFALLVISFLYERRENKDSEEY